MKRSILLVLILLGLLTGLVGTAAATPSNTVTCNLDKGQQSTALELPGTAADHADTSPVITCGSVPR